ncbi:hypothetical protein AB1Y20_018499 [Prymnesium parvum]|uniref:RING-type domain-containing protein n=1 Tax=Prymnesium parvum TaxID=97485 RepID=A0AB34JNU1_PRYPA
MGPFPLPELSRMYERVAPGAHVCSPTLALPHDDDRPISARERCRCGAAGGSLSMRPRSAKLPDSSLPSSLRAGEPTSAGKLGRPPPDDGAADAQPTGAAVGVMVAGYVFPLGANGPRRHTPRRSPPRALTPRDAEAETPKAAIDAYERRVRGLALASDPVVDELLPRVGGFTLKGKVHRAITPVQAAKEGAAEELAQEITPRSANISPLDGLKPVEIDALRPGSAQVALLDEPQRGSLSALASVVSGSAARDGRELTWQEKRQLELLEEAVDERSRLLTRLFQARLKDEVMRMHKVHEAEVRTHKLEVQRLRERYEAHLGEVSEKMREVSYANREAVEAVKRARKLEVECEKLRKAAEAASKAARVAEAREMRANEEREAVVEQLAEQRQRNDELLASHARGGRRSSTAFCSIGAAASHANAGAGVGAGVGVGAEAGAASEASEQAKSLAADLEYERVRSEEQARRGALETASLRDELRRARDGASRLMDSLNAEQQEHARTRRKLKAARAELRLGEQRMAQLVIDEAAMRTASSKMNQVISSLRTFLVEMEAEFDVDKSCLSCLNPLLDPVVLIPCGHSVCKTCYHNMERVAGHSVENAKYCPVCHKSKRRAADEPCEGFNNQMLDAVLSRMRAKHQDAKTFERVICIVSDSLSHDRESGHARVSLLGTEESSPSDDDSEDSCEDSHDSHATPSACSGSDGDNERPSSAAPTECSVRHSCTSGSVMFSPSIRRYSCSSVRE